MKNTEKELKIEVEGNKYTLEKKHRDCFELEEFIDTYTDYFNPFDYIVGDISYSAIRLKGFYRDSKSNNKFNKISFLDNYLERYCSYGTKWFIISKIYKDIK